MECIEHIAQLFSAVVIPDANGTLHVISRTVADAPVALTVDRVTLDQTLCWPDFAAMVVVSSQNSELEATAYGQQGGVKLEVTGHPMLWSFSGCYGMAEALAAWFGVPRPLSEEKWFFTNPDAAAPWEGVRLFSKLTINGGAPVRLMAISQNFIKGTAQVKTVGVN